MRKVHSSDTTPELLFRKALWREGLRYKICPVDLPGKPDLALPSKRLAIFVDGDYWHGNQWRLRRLPALEVQFRETKSKAYWLRKIRRNMARDCSVTAALLSDGWTVLRFWESQIKTDLQGCVKLTLDTIQRGADFNPWSLAAAKSSADFFAGIGLMRMGLEKEGWTVPFESDIDEKKYAMHTHHFGASYGNYVLEDVHNLSPDKVPSVSLATASFPCNDLSLAGSRKGLRGKQSSAFWGFVRILEAMETRRPPLVLLENVAGFLTSHEGKDLTDALLSLNRLNYKIDVFILDAVHFVPQSRKRLFVIGTQTDGTPSKTVSKEAEESALRPKALIHFIYHHPEIDWNIRNLPSPPQRTLVLQDILEDLSDDAEAWWGPERAEYLLNQMSPHHRETAERMIRGKDWTYGTIFRRIRNQQSMAELRTDGIAGCLRTPRGGSGRQILFKAGKGNYYARLLTPRECARLMGADKYKIGAPVNQALFGLGDAVCVPVIEWIAKYYLNPVVNERLRGRGLCLNP